MRILSSNRARGAKGADMTRLIPMLVVTLTLAAGGSALSDGHTDPGTRNFLVTTTHTPEKCLAALDEMAQKDQELLSKIEWGCRSGDHTGYVFISAKTEQEALSKLPEANLATARAEQVTRFTPQQLRSIHATMDAKK
jgi:hypothetical protein